MIERRDMLRFLDQQWARLDRERAATPYPDDQPILMQQQIVEAIQIVVREYAVDKLPPPPWYNEEEATYTEALREGSQ